MEWKAQVYLIGAGPGDPGMLTRRGEECLRRGDVILYDNLTNPELLALARHDAEKIYVGKKSGSPRPDQEFINQLLVSEARKGKIVVRLKGGDSFVFGRGGEEARTLVEAGIRFEIVPGISSAIAVPASAGIPVTYRGINSTLHILTGYEDPADPNCSVSWRMLAHSDNTIVILMGSANIAKILRRLASEGLAAGTPLATIHRGTYPDQKSVRSTLGEAAANPALIHLPSPAITVIGGVAGLDEGLNWFEQRPLFGRRLILARSGEGSGDFAAGLRESGAEVRIASVIRFAALPDSERGFAVMLERIKFEPCWIILPSPAAIRFFFERMESMRLDARALAGAKIAAIGERSAQDLRERGIRADFLPERPAGESVANNLPKGEANTVFIVGAKKSRPELAQGLSARGFHVEHVPLYSTEPDVEGLEELRGWLLSDSADGVAVFSPICAENIRNALGSEAGRLIAAPIWFAIGPTTADAMRELGFNLRGVADRPTVDGLMEAIAAAFARSPGEKSLASPQAALG